MNRAMSPAKSRAKKIAATAGPPFLVMLAGILGRRVNVSSVTTAQLTTASAGLVTAALGSEVFPKMLDENKRSKAWVAVGIIGMVAFLLAVDQFVRPATHAKSNAPHGAVPITQVIATYSDAFNDAFLMGITGSTNSGKALGAGLTIENCLIALALGQQMDDNNVAGSSSDLVMAGFGGVMMVGTLMGKKFAKKLEDSKKGSSVFYGTTAASLLWLVVKELLPKGFQKAGPVGGPVAFFAGFLGLMGLDAVLD